MEIKLAKSVKMCYNICYGENLVFGKDLRSAVMKGAIFDIDGTILDSMSAWVDITNEFFNDHGIAISKEETLSYQSQSFEESLVTIHNEYLPDMSIVDMFADFERRSRENYINSIQPKPYVVDYIKKLYDEGVKLAVATSGFPDLVKAAFTRLDIYKYFSAFTYSREVGCSKSSPDIYLLAAKRLGFTPQECTVFEDIATGIESAKGAGFKTVAIEDVTNTADKDRLIQYSDHYITGWDELLSNK